MSSLAILKTKFETAMLCEADGRTDEAERLYLEILATDPKQAPAADRLGVMALARLDPHTAVSWFETAIAADANFPPALINLGVAFRQLGRLDDAARAFAAVIMAWPDFAAAHYLLGQVVWEQGGYDEASQYIRRAILFSPEFANDYQDQVYDRLSKCDWRGYEAMKALVTQLVKAGNPATSPLNFMYYSNSIADQDQCARTFARRNHPQRPALWNGEPRRPGKIRIGYLSSDFHDHPVAHLLAGVLEAHDRDAFEIVGFSCSPPMDQPIRQRIIPAFDAFLEVAHLNDLAIAQLVRGRDIDILVSLSGYTVNGRPDVLTGRPAPVQVNYHGYPGSLGAPYVDYLIADRQVVPEADARYYVEKLAWLPNSYQPTDDKGQIADATPVRAEAGLPQDGFVFMAYNASRKISPDIFAAWMRILNRTPGSALWLMDSGEAAQTNLRREAQARGVDPGRLVFAPRLDSRADHLARHRLADLFIDTWPYNAHSTASDALWAGLPVLTCEGDTFPSRVGASLVRAAGLGELATRSLVDYEDLAVDLAKDPARMAALRERTRTDVHKSPLFQTAAYTRHLEAAYRTMFERVQAGLPPQAFEVPA